MSLFSVITICKNNLNGLKQTGASLNAQSFSDFEWIVIDGASEDGAPEYLKTTEAQWLSEPDHGIYDAMNKGLRKARGDYLLFLNAGDRLAKPDTFKNISDRMQRMKMPPDFIYGDALEAEKNQLYLKPARPRKKIVTGMFTHHQAMLYRREKLDGLWYDTEFKIAADYDFTARFLEYIGPALYCPFPLCIFESGGVSQKQARLGRKEQFIIRHRRALAAPPLNILIYGVQSVLWEFRSLMPGLYWMLKSSGNKRSGSVQNASPPARPKNRP